MGARSTYTETRALIQAIEDRAKAIIPQQLIQNWFYYRLTKQARLSSALITLKSR